MEGAGSESDKESVRRASGRDTARRREEVVAEMRGTEKEFPPIEKGEKGKKACKR